MERCGVSGWKGALVRGDIYMERFCPESEAEWAVSENFRALNGEGSG